MLNSYAVIIEPVITEKSTDARSAAGVYTFKIDPRATKIDVSRAVEELFKVKVLSVNCVNVKGKKRGMLRRGFGKTSDWKKAYVRIEPNKKIEIFEGT